MRFSIIIPTYNHCDDLLKPCIESILKYTDLTDIEVIIVANGCKDNTAEYVESLGEPFTLIDIREAIGYTKATNIGIGATASDYLILLNNDIVLLEQEKNAWISMLYAPFIIDQRVGISGPIKSTMAEVKREFIIFFCAMVKRSLFTELGLLDEVFTPGGGEDSDFSFKAVDAGYKLAMVPLNATLAPMNTHSYMGAFPIYHKGEATMFTLPNWGEVFKRNTQILIDRYDYQKLYGNNYERAAYTDPHTVGAREQVRYKWANRNLRGASILELGCSNGYGLYFLDNYKTYTGFDYSETIVAQARKLHPEVEFRQVDLERSAEQNLSYRDNIIAFEVIEHLENGLELAQDLKRYCKTLLLTVPYKEQKGFWGEHHKLHYLSEQDLPGFKYQYMTMDGTITDKPDENTTLMLCKWRKETILAFIPTKDRYHTTLPLTIQSVINQTLKPDKLLIYDDSETKVDIRTLATYQYLIQQLDTFGIQWELIYGIGLGQHYGHQIANKSKFDLVWRLDDDNVAEDNVLHTLYANFDSSVGAVAGLVLTPGAEILPRDCINTFENNIQWYRWKGKQRVTHLYSSFLYRSNMVDYELALSPAAHREETIFTQRLNGSPTAFMKMMMENATSGYSGHSTPEVYYKLYVTGNCITWHYRNPEGGIRTHKPENWNADECVFRELQARAEGKLIVYLDSGMGDHVCFNSILPKLKEKYSSIRIFSCFPDLIDHPSESLAVGNTITVPALHNIYKYMIDQSWKGELKDAYEKMYIG